MRLRRLGEFELIKRISKKIPLSHAVVKGIGDDAAVIRYTDKKYLLFTCDMLLEGKHFFRDTDSYLVGKKALSVNVSDIAAMAGVPKFALVSIGVSPFLDVKYIDELYRGITDVAKEFKIDIVGGDTIASEKIIVDISLIGEVEKENVVFRSGARDKDAIFVTGQIGGSLRDGRHLDFTPRLKEARFLAKNFKVTSMIDISDGLLADLGHIIELSGKGCIIREADLPISDSARDIETAIRDGEDFELLFTVPNLEADRLIDRWPFKTRLSRIGFITATRDLHIIKKTGKTIKVKPEGYRHF